MNFIKTVAWALSAALLSSCASKLPEGALPVHAVYCDNFLVYDMCVQDLDADGIVEYVYFTDSKEIFLLRENMDLRISASLTMHRCVQAMSESLLRTTSRMLYIDDSTSYLEKSDIRGALMLKYIALMPEVTSCKMQAEKDEKDEKDERDQVVAFDATDHSV